jgi:hypothetical protein
MRSQLTAVETVPSASWYPKIPMDVPLSVDEAAIRVPFAVPAEIAAAAGRTIAPAPRNRFAPIVRYELRALADVKKLLLCPCLLRW